MKPIFLVLALLVYSLRVTGQAPPAPVPAGLGPWPPGGVNQLPGVSAAELFGRAQALARTSTVASVVNDSAKTMVGRWEQPVGRVHLNYELRVWVREGRYRYELTDFKLRVPARTIVNGYTNTVMEERASGFEPVDLQKLLAPVPVVNRQGKGNRGRGQTQADRLAEQAGWRAALEQATANVQQAMKQPLH